MTIPRIDMAAGGSNFSRLAWGAWRLAERRVEPKQILALVRAAVELGMTTIDHADIYGGYTCEKLFGDALASEPQLRAQLQIVTKCGIKLVSPARPAHRLKQYDTTYAHIIASAENSLAQLRVERIDLLLIHRPDPLMDADEVARAFVDLQQAGKVRYFGVSNFKPAQFDLLASRLSFPLVTNQVQLSALCLDALDDGTLDQCQQLRICPMAWSPLGGGRLLEEQSARAESVRAALAAVATECGAGFDQVAIAWVLMHPSKPLAVLGTVNEQRLRNLGRACDVKLSPEQWFKILAASTGRDVP